MPAPASPLSGNNLQGTLVDSSGGAVLFEEVQEVKENRAAGVTSGSAGLTADEGILPVCMFVTSSENVGRDMCLGCVGTKGEKFCTRRKTEHDAWMTCGTNAHGKKAQLDEDQIYFWDSLRNVGYLQDSLPTSFGLASSVYELRGADLTRVQFTEMVAMVKSREVETPDELKAVLGRIANPAKGVTFTPRKKPKFSGDESHWDYVDVGSMPVIEEAPQEDDGNLQDHIMVNWGTLVKTVEAIKTTAAKSTKYEDEIHRLGEDVDGLNALMSRLQSLMGSPKDGMSFDLFAMMDGVEGGLLELEHAVEKDIRPQLMDARRILETLAKDMKLFRSATGDQVMRQLTSLEEAVRVLEATSGQVPKVAEFTQVQNFVVREVAPALRDMWDFYMLATTGPGVPLRPGSGQPAAGHLFGRLQALEESRGAMSAVGAGTMLTLEQRVRALEGRVSGGAHLTVEDPGLTGLFSTLGGLGDIGGPNPGAGYPPPSSSSPDSDNRMALLEARVTDLDAQLGNVTVTCGGTTFRSIEDCQAFIVEYVPGFTYAYFYDLISLLQRSWGETHVSVSDVWEKLYNMKRAGFTCKGEAVISASMSTILPTCLGELTGKNAECTNALPALPTHKHWVSSGGQMGRRRDIAHCLHNVKGTLETQQRSHFAGNLVGSSLCKELLSMSYAEWIQYQTMLDDFYGEFLATSSPPEAWKLTGMIGKAVLEAQYMVRCIAADVSDLATPVKRAARILWATLQAHRVMQEFITAEFRNDPRIAPIIVLHLLETRIGRSDLERLEKLQNQHEATIKGLRKELDSWVSRVASMQGVPPVAKKPANDQAPNNKFKKGGANNKRGQEDDPEEE
jgi:hypothetical protein